MEGDFQTCLQCTGYDETLKLLEGCSNRNRWSRGLSVGSTVLTGTAGVATIVATHGAAFMGVFKVGDRMVRRVKRKYEKRKVLREHINLIRAARSVTGCKCVMDPTPDAVCGQIELNSAIQGMSRPVYKT